MGKYLIHEGYRLVMLSMVAQQHQGRHHLLSWVPDFSAAPIPMALSANRNHSDEFRVVAPLKLASLFLREGKISFLYRVIGLVQ